MADDAVPIGRAFTAKSLLTGKLTGNFANLQAPTAEVRRNAGLFKYVSDEFPAPLNRESLYAIREFERGKRFLAGTVLLVAHAQAEAS